MRHSLLGRGLLSPRLAALAAGAAALATLPQCSDDPPPAPAGVAPDPAAPASGAIARLAALRARLPGVLDAAPGISLRAPAGAPLRPTFPFASPRTATVTLPPRASGAVRLTDDASGLAVSFFLEGVSDAPATVADGIVLYPAALAGEEGDAYDLLHRAHPAGTEDFVFIEREPDRKELRYRIDVSEVAGLRFVTNTLEMLDAGGVPRLRVAPPHVLDATGRRVAATLALEGCAADASPRAPWGRLVTPPGAASCAVVVRWPEVGVRYPALVDPEWVSTNSSMISARAEHTVTELSPGTPASLVLVAGGYNEAGIPTASAELYEPLSRTFAATGAMAAARAAHTATLLVAQPGAQALVLMAGGTSTAGGGPVSSSERYEQGTGTFSSVPGGLSFARAHHTATRLPSGDVLIAGGTDSLGQPRGTAEVYVRASNTFSATATMSTPRASHAAVLLPNSVLPNSAQVLLCGGFTGAGFATPSAELYNPVANSFSETTAQGAGTSSQMTYGRARHTATVLPSGDVLVAGGVNAATNPVAIWNTAELYLTGTATYGFKQPVLTMTRRRSRHVAVRLTTGDVVLAGGFGGPVETPPVPADEDSTAEIFSLSPPNPAFTAIPTDLSFARSDAAALLVNAGEALSAGKGVLITGGRGAAGAALKTAEVLLKLNGAACEDRNECLSGHCSNKVCCDEACDEACYACKAEDKEDSNILNNGTCGFARSGTPLPQINCINEAEVHLECNNKGQAIPSDDTLPCTPNLCDQNGLVCSHDCQDDDGCSQDGWCDLTDPPGDGGGGSGAGGNGAGGNGAGGAGSAGTCKPTYPNSAECERGRQCLSGHCFDGVCCDAECLGSCQACDVPFHVGTCFFVGTENHHEPPHPFSGRVPCDGEGACIGVCNGQSASCYYPGSDPGSDPASAPSFKDPTCACPDEACSGPAILTRFLCNTHGGYAVEPERCGGENGGFRCDSATACKDSCTDDSDCIADFICQDDGQKKICVDLNVVGPSCDGDHTLRIAGAEDLDCGPYRCPLGEDACPTSCKSVADCVGGTACNAARACVEPPAPPEVLNCSCRAPGHQGDDQGRLAWPLAVALGVAAVRRRGRRFHHLRRRTS